MTQSFQISGDSQMWSRLHQLVNMRRGLDRVLPRLQGTLDLLTSQIVQRQLDDVDQEALQVFEEGKWLIALKD